MTNFSLWDHIYDNVECECIRYKTVTDALSKTNAISVDKAFEILESAKQTDVNGLLLFQWYIRRMPIRYIIV